MNDPVTIPLRSEAFQFILIGIWDWFDLPHRIAIVQQLLDAAGFDARATCAPDFKSLWPMAATGADGKDATKWLDKITRRLPDFVGIGEDHLWVTRKQVKYISEEIHWQREARGFNTSKG